MQVQGGKRVSGENSGVDSLPPQTVTTPSNEANIVKSSKKSEAAARPDEVAQEATKSQVLAPE